MSKKFSPLRSSSFLDLIAPNVDALTFNLIQESHAQSPLRVLDIGAGGAPYWRSGPLCEALKQGKIELTILEPAELDDFLLRLGVTQIRGVAPDHLRPMKSNFFDIVLAFDLIEHLAKHDGYSLIYEMERICSVKAFIFTPQGYVWQPPSTNNSFNAHLSGWTPKDFKSMPGWSVRGTGPMKVFLGPYGMPRIRYRNFLGSTFLQLSRTLTPLVRSSSFAILAQFNKRELLKLHFPDSQAGIANSTDIPNI